MKAVIGSLGLLALLCVVTACGPQPGSTSAGAHAPVKAPAALRARTPLSARIVVPSATMKAGSTMRARIIVDNNTGHVIHTTGCGSLFGIALQSRTYHPTVAWPSCLQQLTIARGQTSYRLSLPATYLQCSNDGASIASPACLPHYKMPPLPPGEYHVILAQQHRLMPTPPAVPVRVAPAG